jgi:hypothetical protein
MADTPMPTRAEAIELIERDRTRTLELVGRIPVGAVTRPGLGGGEWSVKDLLGHLESWEEYALDALAAWGEGRPSRLAELRTTLDIDGVNAHDVERKSGRDWSETRTASERTHAELIATIEATTDDRWEAPAGDGPPGPVGFGIGSILGSEAGPFRHDTAHHRDLQTFADEHGGWTVGRSR